MTSLPVHEFWYDLPAEQIADHPLPNRDQSKLLVYNQGTIEHTAFKALGQHLPENSFLYFNNTRVIPARLHFKKETGADIEIFLLNPTFPSPILAETMRAQASSSWQCTIGNLKRWTNGLVLKNSSGHVSISATLLDREKSVVQLDWTPSTLTFADVIQAFGNTPLPPYIKRSVEKEDVTRYQTIYSAHEGAVAAPTAGLHFTDDVFHDLEKKNIQKDFLTLHVSAGTFQPIKVEDAVQHAMHNEQVVITKSNIENLLQPNQFVVAVGTTSMRTLESLYWFGAKLLTNPHADFIITQHDPYKEAFGQPSKKESLQAVLDRMQQDQVETLTGQTSIYIYPGYTFKICEGLITNFHLPGSTLMLLVAAFIGNDWRKVYQEALDNAYRFLSYGDSSLLIPTNKKEAVSKV